MGAILSSEDRSSQVRCQPSWGQTRSTGRVTPGNLTEQLAMTEVRSAPAGVQLPVRMTDARWPAADGWVKMSQNVNGVEVHYVQNTFTGAVDDFKFIGGAG